VQGVFLERDGAIRFARRAKVGIQIPVSDEEKPHRAVMAAAMLAVLFVFFAVVAGLFFLLTTG
jgi:hypothetical protein